MTTMKTLMLAGVAVASLGIGTAMAQEGGPSMIGPNDYWTLQERAVYAHQAQAPTSGQVQAGSSDTDHAVSGGRQGFDYGTLANPG
jgi:hypothetical protein